MALTSIAPTEKSENLIYAILPVAIGLSIGSWISRDLGQILTVAGAVSSVLTIVLYELRPDERLVKLWFRRRAKERHKELESSFLNWRLFLSSWARPTLEPPGMSGDTPTLAQEVENVAKSVIESNAMRRRFWPIRTSSYLFLAMPLLIWTGIFNVASFVPQIPLLFFTLDLRVYPVQQIELTLILSAAFWIAQLVLGWQSHRTLGGDLLELIKFRHAHSLIAVDALENPSDYSDISERARAAAEMDFLDSVLNRNDWSTFVLRWNSFRQVSETRGRARFGMEAAAQLRHLWNAASKRVFDNAVWNRTTSLDIERGLGWFVYCSTELLDRKAVQIDENTEEQIEYAHCLYSLDTGRKDVLYQGTRLLLGMLNPILVLASVPESLLEDPRDPVSHFTLPKIIVEQIGAAAQHCLDNEERKQVEESVLKWYESGAKRTAHMALWLLSRCSKTTRRSGLWDIPDFYYEPDIAPLKRLRDMADETDRKTYLPHILSLFLREAPSTQVVKLLRSNEWSDYLKQEPAREYLRQVSLGRILAAPEILELVKQMNL